MSLDDASQFDMFRRDSDLEDQGDHDDLEETELKWRKERFEREQWLREQVERLIFVVWAQPNTPFLHNWLSLKSS